LATGESYLPIVPENWLDIIYRRLYHLKNWCSFGCICQNSIRCLQMLVLCSAYT